MANITLPDGTVIPEYALETTQASMEKLLTAIVGSNDKTLKYYETLVKNSGKQNKNQEDANKTNEENLNALKGLRKDVKEGKTGFLSIMGPAANTVADGLIKVGTFATGLALSGFGLLAKNAYNLGNTLADLGQVGLGLDGVGDTTVSTIASLNRLGLTSAEAAGVLAGSASTIAAIGQSQFVQVNSVLADMTRSGANFGITMNELVGLAAEDLETRQKLGILDNLNASQAAKRSAELYQSQLNATKLLGKSIDDIRGASRVTLQENAEFALRVQGIGVRLGDDVARGFTQQMERGLGALAGSGLNQSLIDSIGNEIGAAVAFASDSGQELFRTLNFINPELSAAVKNMNQIAKSNDPEAIGGAMDQFQQKLLDTALSMDDKKFDALSAQLLAGNLGQAGIAFASSLGELRIAAKKFQDSQFDAVARFSELAKGAVSFDNAMAKFSGGIAGMFNDMSGALGPAVSGFMSAFDDVVDENGKIVDGQMGISTAFKVAMADVGETIASLFGNAEGEFTNLGDMLKNYVVPKIQAFAEWFKGGGAQKIFDAMKALGSVAAGVTKPFLAIFKLLTGDFSGAFTTLGSSFNSLAGIIGTVIGGFILLNKGMRLASGAKGLLGMFGGGGGAAGSAVASAASGGAGGAGAAVGQLSKGVGKESGGIFKSLAMGLSAFGAPALKGAGFLSAAILIIGGAVAGATWMMGKALPTLAEGLAEFSDVDGMNLIKVGAGLTALGVGLVSLAAGSVAGLIGGIADSISSFFGGDTPFDKVEKFGKLNINADRVKGNSEAVVAYSKAMAALGAGTAVGALGGLVGAVAQGITGFFNVKPPLEEMKKFSQMSFNGKQIKENSEAVAAYGKAMSSLNDSQVGILGAISAGLAKSLNDFFGVDTSPPWDEIKAFGDIQINTQGVKNNAEAVSAYGQAMASVLDGTQGFWSNLGEAFTDFFQFLGIFDSDEFDPEPINAFGNVQLVGADRIKHNAEIVKAFGEAMTSLGDGDMDGMEDMADLLEDGLVEQLNKINDLALPDYLLEEGFSVGIDNLSRLAGAYAAFAEIDGRKLTRVSTGIENLNKAIGSSDSKEAIVNVLANLSPAAPQTEPPAPAGAELVGPPAPEGMGTGATATPPQQESGDATTDLATLIRRTNQKLDKLIEVNTKQL